MREVKALLAGKIFTPTEEIHDGVILISDHRISAVGRKEKVKVPAGAQVVDIRHRIVVPGFMDLHIHGASGHDLMPGTSEAITAVANYLARHGTTSFLATTVTASRDSTLHAAAGLAAFIKASHNVHGASHKLAGAQPVGIHFEGPFLNVKKRGAHPASQIHKPSIELLERMLAAAAGTARILSLAPEQDGALSLMDYARSKGLRVGIGHSMATFEEAERAIAAGATVAVHVFNAMRPFHHRDPGLLGAVLVDQRISCELICDGVHVAPSTVRLLAEAKGMEKVLLVTWASW